MSRVSRGFVFFCLISFLLVGHYLWRNAGLDLNSLSSDVWAYQFLEIQNRFNYWSEIPPSYNQSELYIAFPLFYFLNPQFEQGLLFYHVLAVVLIFATYFLNGAVVYTLFRQWTLAALGGALMVIPRYIFPTQIGILSISQVRAVTLLYPLYFLLTYYWILRGIKNPKTNIALGALAGTATYIYPPTAITLTLFSVVTALIIYRTRYLKELGIFCITVGIVALPFLINHFTHPDTGTVKETSSLTSEDLSLQTAAATRAFGGNASLLAVDFEEMKRIVWDQTPLIVLFMLSLILMWRHRRKIEGEKVLLSLTSMTLLVCTWTFVLSIEILNWYSLSRGGSYVFSEHVRILRGTGFILFMQSIMLVHLLILLRQKVLVMGVVIILIASPLFFAADIVRSTVRAVIPVSVRQTYNLAPVVEPAEEKSFQNLKYAALWARENLSAQIKFFLFTEYQSELQFKLLSRKDTNMLEKESALWATSGFENSKKWFLERERYDEIVKDVEDFNEILTFARETGATHMLLPRGTYTNLFEASGVRLPILYTNPDYKIIGL